VLSRFEGEVGYPKEAQKGLKKAGLVGMRTHIFLHAGPEFCRDDHGDARDGGVGQFFEPGLVAQNWDADAGIQEE
jgi:hypothetical protein